MSADDDNVDDNDDNDDNVDFVLGELDAKTARLHQRRLGEEPELAREAGEIRALIEDLRELDTEPSHTIPLRVRYALERRLRLRLRGGMGRMYSPFSPRLVLAGVGQMISHGLQVAAVALVVCYALLYLEGRLSPAAAVPAPVAVAEMELPQPRPPVLPIPDEPVVPAQCSDVLPEFVHDEPEFERQLRSLAREEDVPVSDFEAFVDATNKLFALRRESQVRVSPRQRQRAIREGGSSTSLDSRIQDLATEIAAKIDRRLAAQEATVMEVSLAVRALLAAGSCPDAGAHGDSVRRCARYLEERIGDLKGAQLASGLAGLMDLAVVTGKDLERLVGEHVDRLAHAVFYAEGEKQRPSLLHWETPAASLADAGVVLRLAPAFGVNVVRAGRARRLLAAHVQERMASTRNERPDLVAALLYGFGDLVDRRELDHKLLLWSPRRLVFPGHFVALHHVSWSQFPARRGWARFQDDLRAVSVMPTPEDVGDASALLLALAMNYAAPGSSEMVAQAGAGPE